MIQIADKLLATIYEKELTPQELVLFNLIREALEPLHVDKAAELLGGVTETHTRVLVSNLRRKLAPYKIYIKAKRRKGFILTDKSNRKPTGTIECGVTWKPRHRGDPLLKALRREHDHGLGNYT